MRCPNCGSSAQPKVVSTEYHEDGWDIEVVRHYVCGCGEKFVGLSCYHCDSYEIVECEKMGSQNPFIHAINKYNEK